MIVIGDVHGEYDLLMKLISILPQTERICFVGDLIDRGPKSKEVIEFIRKNKYFSVYGNHECMATNELYHETWFMNGAMPTVQSYGGYQEFLNHDDFNWLKNLPYIIEYKDYIISHSFLWNGEETTEHDIIWGRYFLEDNCKKVNIFGHSPEREPYKINNKHWCIDTGAFYYRRLTAIDLDDNEKIYYVEK